MIINNETIEKPVLERIRLLINSKCKSQKEFCKKVGLNEKTLSSMFTRNSNPKYETLFLIISAFEDVSANWILTGKGEMLLKKDNEETKITDANEYLVKRFEEVLNELRDIKDVVDEQEKELKILREEKKQYWNADLAAEREIKLK